jgi:CRISPR-associated protein Csb1
MRLTAETLLAAGDDYSRDGGLRIDTELEPLGGPGSLTKPAIYSGGTYQHQRRWWGDGDDRRRVDAIVIDNEPSQANRMEGALERRASEAGLPRMVLDLTETEPLPPHLPRTLSSYRWPHRHADAYLRDALLDGTPFPRTELGKRLYQATADDPTPLLEWFPHSLLFGFWQSHLGTGAQSSQAKLARSWRSSVVGIEPGSTDTRQLGLKGDPLNLTLGKGGLVHHDPRDQSDWLVAEDGKGPKGRETVKLSEIGHGQVIIAEDGQNTPGPAAVSFEAIAQIATLSLPDLRRVWVAQGRPNAAARALLAAIGILGHVGAFGGPFTLRSDCDLRPTATRWTWLGADGDEDVEPLTEREALELVADTASAAEETGLPVGSRWPDQDLTLTPAPALAEVIRKTYPAVD